MPKKQRERERERERERGEKPKKPREERRTASVVWISLCTIFDLTELRRLVVWLARAVGTLN